MSTTAFTWLMHRDTSEVRVVLVDAVMVQVAVHGDRGPIVKAWAYDDGDQARAAAVDITGAREAAGYLLQAPSDVLAIETAVDGQTLLIEYEAVGGLGLLLSSLMNALLARGEVLV